MARQRSRPSPFFKEKGLCKRTARGFGGNHGGRGTQCGDGKKCNDRLGLSNGDQVDIAKGQVFYQGRKMRF